jgi:hypothetical protein
VIWLAGWLQRQTAPCAPCCRHRCCPLLVCSCSCTGLLCPVGWLAGCSADRPCCGAAKKALHLLRLQQSLSLHVMEFHCMEGLA